MTFVMIATVVTVASLLIRIMVARAVRLRMHQRLMRLPLLVLNKAELFAKLVLSYA